MDRAAASNFASAADKTNGAAVDYYVADDDDRAIGVCAFSRASAFVTHARYGFLRGK